MKWEDLPVGAIYKMIVEGELRTWTVVPPKQSEKKTGYVRLEYHFYSGTIEQRTGVTGTTADEEIELGPHPRLNIEDRWIVLPEPIIEEDPI